MNPIYERLQAGIPALVEAFRGRALDEARVYIKQQPGGDQALLLLMGFLGNPEVRDLVDRSDSQLLTNLAMVAHELVEEPPAAPPVTDPLERIARSLERLLALVADEVAPAASLMVHDGSPKLLDEVRALQHDQAERAVPHLKRQVEDRIAAPAATEAILPEGRHTAAGYPSQ